uniref:WD_REPEATS_REGION domain-containing protein n=1 Tax=Meloidogyne hapla TaxID=6305 RepID=A0A1I8AYW5_MELHA
MPCIFWHDRKGILSIDVLQNSTTKQEDIPIYKIVTASIQKEIRVWNFRFDPIEASPEDEKLNNKISPEKQQKDDQMNEEDKQQNEDSIVFVDQKEKEEEQKENATNIEAKKDELLELDEAKVQQQKSQASNKSLSLSVEFLANLDGHRSTTNVVKFSPNGNLIASGDADGYLIVWNLLQPSPDETTNEKQLKELQLNNLEDKNNEIPPNRENWQRSKARFSPHPGEITAICFSPDSQFIASVSMNNSISVNRSENGKRLWERGSYRHFANGITWDPRGKYLVTMSTDRRLDILDAFKGTILRSCCQIELPTIQIPEINQQIYKIFHDDQLHAFQRGVEFSPCGGVIFAPAAQLEVGTNNIYGTFIFFRNDLKFCRPNALFPSSKPTIQVKCSPLIYKLEVGTKENFLGLPHRLIFAVLCWDSILLYNSQNETPFAYLANLHYDGLTSIAWTPDGRFLVVSSLEGFNSFICMDTKKMGDPVEAREVLEKTQQDFDKVAESLPSTTTNTPKQIIELSLPDSPKLITPRRPRAKRTINDTPQTPKRAKPEETCSSVGESPKVAEKKKPRKVTVISTD